MSISLDTKSKALCVADGGDERRPYNSLDAAKEVASQIIPGNKVQKHMILAASRTELLSIQLKKNMCFILSLIAKIPVTHRGSTLPNSRSDFQGVSTKPEPAHITHNLLRLQGGLQPDCAADQPVAGPCQPTANPKAQT
eukprot:183007-Pelagomonas_calceolata.AAC.1